MLRYRFSTETLLAGFVPLLPSGFLITATIPDEVRSSSLAFAKRNNRGIDPFQPNGGRGFMNFAPQSQGYETWKGHVSKGVDVLGG